MVPGHRAVLVAALIGFAPSRSVAQGTPASNAARDADRIVTWNAKECSVGLPPFEVAMADEPAAERRAREGAMSSVDVPSTIRAALRTARNSLSGPTVTVCVALARPSVPLKFLGGVSGFYQNGTINLFIDPQPGWNALLSFVVTHEFHHAAVAATGSGLTAATPFDAAMIEAKADLFASTLHADVSRPWYTSMKPDADRACRAAFDAGLRQGDVAAFRTTVMLGGRDSVPFHCGRALGREAILAYMRERPGTSLPAMTATSSSDILAAWRRRSPAPRP